MKIEDQVCNLEQAIKLKELGLTDLTLFTWKCNKTQDVVIDTPMAFCIEKYVPPIGNTYYPAYNTAELYNILPDMITTDRQYELVIVKESDCTLVRYCAGNDIKNTLINVGGNGMADTLASMLIQLLLKKLTTL